MKRPLIVSPEAEQDLTDAKTWYEQRRVGLGEEFLLCVEEAFERIERMPEGAGEVYPSVRRVAVRRFPYGVFYCVDADQIAILAVYHGSRDPRGWQDRSPD